jgi:hypothetical protein
MTCSDVERLLPELLDGASDGVFPPDSAAFQAAFDIHVKSCPDCSDLVSDLKLIASEARQLEATEEPAPRVWLQIAAQLRAEGLIREPAAIPGRPILVPASPRRRWSAWWLAPVAAGLLAAASYVASHRPAAPTAQQHTPPTPTVTTPGPAVAAAPSDNTTSEVHRTSTVATTHVPVEQPAPQPRHIVKSPVEPPSSAEDQQFLRAVSTSAPSMRATYENQLQAVNADIRETQDYVDRNPGDADARQHLMDAYQQKALLYQIALDRIQ